MEQSYQQDVETDTNISWAAYHAGQQSVQNCLPAITALLPLFPDDSKSVAMIQHSMDNIQESVQKLNPGQIPVITCDQPLYTLAKQIQWHWPSTHGEDKFIVILGGLHIEMAALKLLGDWLEDCGWVEVLVQSKVASAGTAESHIKVSHVTRTRHAHQVTACSLYILLKKSYDQYKESLDPSSGIYRLVYPKARDTTISVLVHSRTTVRASCLNIICKVTSRGEFCPLF